MSERWLPVSGHPAYEVSDRGRVRRALPGRGTHVGRVLAPCPHPKGYVMVHVGRRRKVTIHALVAAAFLGPRPPGHEVNHENGRKDDNRAANLSYATSSENKRHAVRAGIVPTGARHPNARHSDAAVAEARRAVTAGESAASVARRLGTSRAWASMVARGLARAA